MRGRAVSVRFFPGRVPAAVATAALLAVGLLVDAPAALAQTAAAPAAAKPVVTERETLRAAVAAAVAQGSRVEILSERSEMSRSWANPDGSITAENAAAPERVRQADGSWADVDLTLVAGESGWVPRMPAVPFVLSPGGDSTLATERIGGGIAQVGWDQPLPAPKVSGSEAVYAEVRPGVDLVVRALRTGLEIDFVVRTAPSGDLSLPLSLSTSGLTASARADGGLRLLDEKGATVGESGQAVVWDAQVVEGTTYPKRQTVAGSVLGTGVAATLTPVAASKASPVSVPAGTKGTSSPWAVTVPAAFLADPATRYPVTVDPAVVTSTNLDTYVDGANPSTSFSTSTRLYIGTPDTSSNNIKRTYLRFPTPTNLIGKFVSSSYLQMYNSLSSTCAASLAPVNVYGLGSMFTSTTTWATRITTLWPGAVPTGTANYVHNGPAGACGAADYDNVWITPVVKSWADSSNTVYGLQVSSVENDNHGYKEFFSADAGSGIPHIYTTYWAYPSTPTAPSVTPSGGPISGAWRTNQTTPTLSTLITSATGNGVQARFEIYSGATLVWSGLGTAVASGVPSTVTVPAGAGLTAGSTYTVKAVGLSGIAESLSASDATTLVIDTTAPNTPTVTSTDYASGVWAGGSAPGSFTGVSDGLCVTRGSQPECPGVFRVLEEGPSA